MKKTTTVIGILIVIVAFCAIGVCACANINSASYSLTYVAGDGGSMQGVVTQTVNVGQDGTTVTAVPFEGYRFVSWSDGVTRPERTDVQVKADISVTACFEKIKHIVYYNVKNATVLGQVMQMVEHGASTMQITVVPDKGFDFVSWSDGNTSLSRHDQNIIADLTVSAIVVTHKYSVSYFAENGTIQGEATQSILHNSSAATVTAVPNAGYQFVAWSDGVATPTRTDTEVKDDLCVKAKFQKISVTCLLDYQLNSESQANKPEVTFEYGELQNRTLPVLTKDRFVFCGWYLGDTKVADETGKMIVGNELFDLAKNNVNIVKHVILKAKWQACETFSQKILLVYVTQIQATLTHIKDESISVPIDYTMSDLERRFCQATTKNLQNLFNEMLDGLVNFQVDEYFTTQPIVTEDFVRAYPKDGTTTFLFADQIAETANMADDYDGVFTVVAIGDYSHPHPLFRTIGVTKGTTKYAQVCLDTFLFGCTVNGSTIETEVNKLLEDVHYTDNINVDWGSWLDHFIHEFAHIVETRFQLANFHSTACVNELWLQCEKDILQAYKLYYMNEIVVDGVNVGIPYEYWVGKGATIKYDVTHSDISWFGKLQFIQPDGTWGQETISVQKQVVYNTTVTVRAVSTSRYVFVGWSDGVTTAERTDVITEDFEVTAIFVLKE